APLFFDPVRRGLERRAGARHQYDRRALAGEEECDGLADAAARARDDRDLARQTFRHCTSVTSLATHGRRAAERPGPRAAPRPDVGPYLVARRCSRQARCATEFAHFESHARRGLPEANAVRY